VKKPCRECNGLFDVSPCRFDLVHFCGVECRRAEVAKRRAKVCPWCGRHFDGNRDKVYCSRRCGYAQRTHDREVKPCENCGGPIKGQSNAAIKAKRFCSPKCKFTRRHDVFGVSMNAKEMADMCGVLEGTMRGRIFHKERLLRPARNG
jgi:hypothetical protein